MQIRRFSHSLFIIAIVALLLLAAGCSDLKRVSLLSAHLTQFEMENFTRGAIGVDVELSNPSRYLLSAENGSADLKANGKVFATLRQKEWVSFPSKGTTVQRIWFTLELKDLGTLLSSGLNIAALLGGRVLSAEPGNSWDVDQAELLSGITADWSAKISAGSLSKRIGEKDVPLQQLLKQFGISR